MDEQQTKVAKLFMPYAMRKMEELGNNGTNFVHYTSAAVAMEIIEKSEIWMRNASVMNDFREIQHGQDCIAASWHDDVVGGRLRRVLDELDGKLSQSVSEAFDANQIHRARQSYLLSLSEHGSVGSDEDKHGRLSMWRAYGGDTSVAFVIKNDPFQSDSNAVKAFLSPVLYADSEGFKPEFKKIVKGLEDNIEFLKEIGPEQVFDRLVRALHFAALSTKHPGFDEEKEWRLIYSPTIIPDKHIDYQIGTVQGVPQKVYKLKLMNQPDEGLVGATLPELLEKIIIGPTQNPLLVYEALVSKLEDNGVSNAREKVKISGIPLRR